MVNSDSSGNLILRLWLLIHRSDALLKTCEDHVFSKYKLTTEQFAVLTTIKYLGDPVRPTDVARWLARSPNSISMMVDRMVEAGLVRRIRDRVDRRVVRLVITSKAEDALKPAAVAGWEFIQEIMSPLSSEDKRTLISLLGMINYKTLKYLHPRADIEAMMRNETKQHANLMERLTQYISPSTPEAKRQGKKKGKTI